MSAEYVLRNKALLEDKVPFMAKLDIFKILLWPIPPDINVQ